MVALLLTFGMFVGFIVSIVTIVVVPATLALQPGLGWTAALVDWLRWPVMAIFAMGGLATLYRYGPSRRNARWRWVSIGAVVATALWILVSLAFSLYVSEFAAYNRFYGTLGGVAVLMIWFWLSAWIVLAGAELNSEIEAQHRSDMSAKESRMRARLAAMRTGPRRRAPEREHAAASNRWKKMPRNSNSRRPRPRAPPARGTSRRRVARRGRSGHGARWPRTTSRSCRPGVAFFGLLAMFPALAAFVAIAGS
jgi:uncharacterized BrkB/YihY/UPF0761 family membrane protein